MFQTSLHVWDVPAILQDLVCSPMGIHTFDVWLLVRIAAEI